MRPDTTGRSVPYDEADLLRRARAVRSRAYAPYSHFHVGAIVVTPSGTYEGVNVENASYRMTTCAEQTAIARMVAEGDRGPILAVAVVGDGADPCTPCGACRQTISSSAPMRPCTRPVTGGTRSSLASPSSSRTASVRTVSRRVSAERAGGTGARRRRDPRRARRRRP
jgi:cytidine deaminase